MAAVDVRPGRRSDVRELADVLGRAFHDDPVMKWILPDDADRGRGLTRMFATMTRHHFLRGGGVEVAAADDGLGAAALWDPPGRWKQTRLEEFLMMPAFVRAFGKRVAIGQQVADLMKEHHPEEPHWYLGMPNTSA